jgi:ABC-2 type transport system permease protein
MKLGNQLRNINTIAYYTYKELIKSKILYNTLALGFALLVITYVAFSFTYGEPARVALDFGLGTLSLSCVGIAIFMGVGLIYNELESRTIYLVISRPIKRSSFVVGKLFGLISVLVINSLILSLLTLILYFLIGGEWSSLILWSIIFILAEAIIMLFISVLFSLLSTKVLSVIFALSIYVTGHAVDGAKFLTFVENRPFLQSLLELYQFLLPAFYKLNIKEFVLYKNQLEWSYLISTGSYAVVYSLGILALIILIFNKKSFD